MHDIIFHRCHYQQRCLNMIIKSMRNDAKGGIFQNVRLNIYQLPLTSKDISLSDYAANVTVQYWIAFILAETTKLSF